MPAHRTAIVWFRRDLRLADNPALSYALENAERIVPLYLRDDGEDPWRPGAASRWWLHHSLTSLSAELKARGAGLAVRRGESVSELRSVVRASGATLVAWNALFEPHERALEQRVRDALGQELELHACNGGLWFDPGVLRNRQGQPYRVFTPFWRAIEPLLDSVAPPAKAPRKIPRAPAKIPSAPIAELELLPKIGWYDGLAESWKPGEAGALANFRRFMRGVARYPSGRDRPDVAHTSRLSPFLHFGEISPRQALAALRGKALEGAATRAAATAFLRELAWREFAHHLLFHFPHTTEHCLDQRFDQMAWSRDDAAAQAWRRGLTGVPIVDAGMRELWRTGWMHNRVRMIVASYLTKNLQTHWLTGARWFWDTLVDADLANNTLNWQWVAGCGADAAPYYRIFNPVLQAERFDPKRRYIRRYIPELARLPDAWIHQPWAAPRHVLDAACVTLDVDYPRPIVDLAASRNAALAAYADIKD